MSEWTALINRFADEGVDVDASNALRLLMGLRAGVPLGRLAVMFDVPLTTEERLALESFERGTRRNYVAQILGTSPASMTRLEQRVIRDCVRARRLCAGDCGTELPLSSRRHRIWCSNTCRMRVSRNSARAA